MSDSFHHLAEILCWNEPERDKLALLERRYFSALCHRLGVTLARLRTREPALAQEVETRLSMLSDEVIARSLLEPATSRRIVTDLHSMKDVAAHLLCVAPSEPVGHLLGLIPVHSEFADSDDARNLLDRVERLAQAIATVSPAVSVFLRTAMRELVLRELPGRPEFFSNSPQGYVGRAVITNGHLAVVDDVMLVEALVHEATHGLVGMSEAIGLSGIESGTPWLSDNHPYDGVSRVTSPWTGTPLDIPTYLHACFVWWGLLHFWARMCEQCFCDQRRTRSRLVRAIKGFENDAFIYQLEPYRAIIAAPLFDVFEDMAGTLRDAQPVQSKAVLL